MPGGFDIRDVTIGPPSAIWRPNRQALCLAHEARLAGVNDLPNASVVVLVCGERLRRDDGAALAAAELLPPDVLAVARVVEVGQLSVEAVLHVPETAAIVVVDAVRGVAPGSVVVLPLAEVAGGGAGGEVAEGSAGAGPRHAAGHTAGHTAPASSHALPPNETIALAAELRGAMPRGVFVGIGGAEFGFGEGLSAAVAAALPGFAATLADEIRNLAADSH
jgi:Ni,Fe-hydrogenase maturation factor